VVCDVWSRGPGDMWYRELVSASVSVVCVCEREMVCGV